MEVEDDEVEDEEVGEEEVENYVEVKEDVGLNEVMVVEEVEEIE